MSQSIASFITQTLEQAGVKRIWGGNWRFT